VHAHSIANTDPVADVEEDANKIAVLRATNFDFGVDLSV
jgi:hypothetical protein